ncbi:junctophilin-1 [Harmonia axyridis]|uniref:junctophilin-1 n=1 Tax=Harmonia axyridis TaxID=115357 RepID=UPI001E278EE1|nr:junctophilin-1 [Harmonia axyridis]
MQNNQEGPSPAATGATGTASTKSHVNGGRFDFDDGGTYCGGWEEGKAHGHGVCTGPKGQGAYSGSWHYGFEVSGVYNWPSGSCFEGQWQNGKRHGLGVETRGRWIYRGEWTQGFKGRYGVRQSNTSTAKYEGTWANGLQDGYGSETYADDGTYQGQWMRGMRHGYGIRTSAPFGKASKYRANKNIRASLTSLRSSDIGNAAPPEAIEKRDRRAEDARGGFVLKRSSAEPQVRRRSLGSGNIKKGILMGLKLKKQRSTGDLEGKRSATTGSIRSAGSSSSWMSTDSMQSGFTNTSIPSDSNASFVVEDEQMDPNVTETYMGEWKNDKRSGYGISERTDGLKYEGEWFANKKYGYGVTTFSNGDKEEGKYKNNVLITSSKRKLFLMRSAKFRERIEAAVNAAQRASKIALQKADIAITRTAAARGKGEQADQSAAQAREDSDIALAVAKQYAPDFKQPGLERLRQRQLTRGKINSDLEPTANAIHEEPKQNEYNQMNSNPGHKLDNQMGNSINVPNNYSQNYQDRVPKEQQYQQQYQYHQNRLNSVSMTDGNPYNKPILKNHVHEFGPQVPNNVDKMNDSYMARPRNSITMDNHHGGESQGNNMVRKLSRQSSRERPYLGNISQQSSIDHFDHYKRPPSRDSSVDRYSRATGRLSASGSRQASIDRTIKPSETPDRTIRAPSIARSTTPVSPMPPMQNFQNRNGGVPNASFTSIEGSNGPNGSPFEDIIMRKRGLGQDIIPSPNQPKRTESLFIPGGGSGAATAAPPVSKNLMTQTSLARKKSLPDVQELPRATYQMSREEVSALGSARREEVRRQIDEKERLKANPLLWLVSPQVKDWIYRQQLLILVLFVNVCLAIMFVKLLT